MKNEILIWGAGAIGGVLGAYWARAGQPVTMVDIVADHVTACRTEGLKIEGPVEEFTQVVPAVLPEKLTKTYSCGACRESAGHGACCGIYPAPLAGGWVHSVRTEWAERKNDRGSCRCPQNHGCFRQLWR